VAHQSADLFAIPMESDFFECPSSQAPAP